MERSVVHFPDDDTKDPPSDGNSNPSGFYFVPAQSAWRFQNDNVNSNNNNRLTKVPSSGKAFKPRFFLSIIYNDENQLLVKKKDLQRQIAPKGLQPEMGIRKDGKPNRMCRTSSQGSFTF